MNSKQRKALEVKASKQIKAIMKKHPLFKDTDVTVTFKSPRGENER